MMSFVTLYCDSHWRYFTKVMLVDPVHFPHWNMTLSQKIALNFCHFFTSFCLFFCHLSVQKSWWRELWIKKTDFFFNFSSCYGQPVLPLPRALFPALPSTDLWHFQWLFLGLAFGSWSLADIPWGLWPLSSPGLTSRGTGRSRKPSRIPAHSRGQRGRAAGSSKESLCCACCKSPNQMPSTHSTSGNV